MSDEERKNLLEEANLLGIEFPSNVKTQKLKGLIAEAKGLPAPVDEAPPAGPAMSAEAIAADAAAAEEAAKDKDEPEVETKNEVQAAPKALTPHARRRAKVSAAKAKAFKKSIVTITNKDNRENDIMTTVYLSFENQYFGLSKVVPLDVPVELEHSLIRIAASTIMTLHKDEIVDGKRTGNKVPMRVKKFAISYSRQEPED